MFNFEALLRLSIAQKPYLTQFDYSFQRIPFSGKGDYPGQVIQFMDKVEKY